MKTIISLWQRLLLWWRGPLELDADEDREMMVPTMLPMSPDREVMCSPDPDTSPCVDPQCPCHKVITHTSIAVN